MKQIIALLLALSMALPLVGCGAAKGEAASLTDGLRANPVSLPAIDHFDGSAAVADLSVKLLQKSEGGESVLVSPVSILYALAMTMNGAEGETLRQMEETLGASRTDLNVFLAGYLRSLPETKDAVLHLANSLWLRDEKDRLHVEPDFLQTNVDLYDAEVFSAPFDKSTVKDINAWAKENTHGMIPEVLDNIPDNVVMYLINALSFEAKWLTVYEEAQVREDVFTTEAGEEQDCELMWSGESDYIADDNAQGFLKHYRGGYAFAALLPREGMTVAEYLATLDGKTLNQMLCTPQEARVTAAIPKFTGGSALELAEVLSDMGMTDLFNAQSCDLTGMGTSEDGNLFVSRVLHKTFIQVDEEGTRAGAVTAGAPAGGCAPPEERHEVILNRPFVYFLLDTDTMTPIFMGTYMGM